MPNKSVALARRRLRIITRYQHNRVDVLTIDPDGDGGCLAIFSFKEEAETFLTLLGDDKKSDWLIKETSVGELVSVLLGPCAGVRWVTLDPLPLLFSRSMCCSVSVNRQRFLEDLMEERHGPVGELVPA